MHSHSVEVLPFAVGSVPLRPVIQNGGVAGEHIPVWDIRDKFGDTNLLVVNERQGIDLAARLAGNNVVLMRGHGFAAAARSLVEAIRMCVYLSINARVLSEALRFGQVKYLSVGEIAKIQEYGSQRAGIAAGVAILGRPCWLCGSAQGLQSIMCRQRRLIAR